MNGFWVTVYYRGGGDQLPTCLPLSSPELGADLRGGQGNERCCYSRKFKVIQLSALPLPFKLRYRGQMIQCLNTHLGNCQVLLPCDS